MAMLDSFKDLKKDKTVHAIFILLVIIIVIAIIYKIYQAVQTAGNLVGDQMGKQIIAAQTGVSVARQNVCMQVCNTCIQSIDFVVFTNVWYWCDSQAITDALNQLVSDDEVSLASLYFKQQRGFSLKSVCDSWHFTHPEISITHYGGLN